MTGLTNDDHLLEIACMITEGDPNLTTVAEVSFLFDVVYLLFSTMTEIGIDVHKAIKILAHE